MLRNPWMIVVGCIALLGGNALGQADVSDAKVAAKGFYSAVAGADSAGIQKILIVENDPQQKLSRGYAELILAGKKLGEAAKSRFPGAVGAFAQGTISPEDAHLIDKAEVKVDGSKATLKLPARPDVIELRKMDGAWKVFIPQTDQSPARLEQQQALLAGWVQVMNQTATEITDNQFRTIQDAEAAVKERLGAVLAKALQGSPPSSQPASQPSAAAAG